MRVFLLPILALVAAAAVAQPDPSPHSDARLVADATRIAPGDTLGVALEITVEEVFFHCAKAFLRSDAWDPQRWDPTAVPSVAQMAKAMRTDMSLEELERYFSEENMRSMLY